MPSCAAVNCSSRSEKGIRLFRFPANKERRLNWSQKLRRTNWIASNNSFLCEKHFEDSQFENHRLDGWRKLKPNAVPTIFNLPDPLLLIDRPQRKLSLYKKFQIASPAPEVEFHTDLAYEEICEVVFHPMPEIEFNAHDTDEESKVISPSVPKEGFNTPVADEKIYEISPSIREEEFNAHVTDEEMYEVISVSMSEVELHSHVEEEEIIIVGDEKCEVMSCPVLQNGFHRDVANDERES